jgi:hypothetical protein
MENLKIVFEELLEAPLSIIEWQILFKHPELWSDGGIAWVEGEREEARRVKDYKRIQKLSSKLLLFERCRSGSNSRLTPEHRKSGHFRS